MDTRRISLRMRGMPFISYTPNYWRDIVVSSTSSPIGIVIGRLY